MLREPIFLQHNRDYIEKTWWVEIIKTSIRSYKHDILSNIKINTHQLHISEWKQAWIKYSKHEVQIKGSMFTSWWLSSPQVSIANYFPMIWLKYPHTLAGITNHRGFLSYVSRLIPIICHIGDSSIMCVHSMHMSNICISLRFVLKKSHNDKQTVPVQNKMATFCPL